jgi:hypothetical protein
MGDGQHTAPGQDFAQLDGSLIREPPLVLTAAEETAAAAPEIVVVPI